MLDKLVQVAAWCFLLQVCTLGINNANPLCLEPCNTGHFMNYTTLLCQPCPTGTYNAFPGCPSRCTRCRRHCEDPTRSNVVRFCSPHNDLECRCSDGFYAPSQDSVCYPQPKCGVGYGVKYIGTPTQPTLCQKCPRGTESNSDSAVEPCRPIRNKFATSERKSAVTVMAAVTSSPRSSTPQTTESSNETRLSGNFMLLTVLSVTGSSILVVVLAGIIFFRCRRLKLKQSAPRWPIGSANTASEPRNVINFVAQKLSPVVWRQFVRCLPGAPEDNKIAAIVQDNRWVRDQIYEALKLWCDENPQATTVDLVNALKKIKQNKLAQELKESDGEDSSFGSMASDARNNNADSEEKDIDEGKGGLHEKTKAKDEEQTLLKKTPEQ